jgi:hypothetical protein
MPGAGREDKTARHVLIPYIEEKPDAKRSRVFDAIR